MDYHSLSMKTVAELRKLCKEADIKVPSGATKALIIDMLLKAAPKEAPQQIAIDSAAKPAEEAGPKADPAPAKRRVGRPPKAAAAKPDKEAPKKARTSQRDKKPAEEKKAAEEKKPVFRAG